MNGIGSTVVEKQKRVNRVDFSAKYLKAKRAPFLFSS